MQSILIYLNFLLCLCICPLVLCKNYNTKAVAISRATTFIPKVKAKVCYLKPQKGPCRANIRMFYFHPDEMRCRRFDWGGCQGNGNRFISKADCLNNCLSKEGYRDPKPKYCDLTFDYGYCFGAVERWYYDRVWKVCKKTIFSGCGGNGNNFYNKEQCTQVCVYGNKPLKLFSKNKSGAKNVLIINPPDITKKRRQVTMKPTAPGTIGHIDIGEFTETTVAPEVIQTETANVTKTGSQDENDDVD